MRLDKLLKKYITIAIITGIIIANVRKVFLKNKGIRLKSQMVLYLIDKYV